MDTAGAAIGPILALLYLESHPGHYGNLYAWAFIPAALAAIATMFVRESRFVPSKSVGGFRSLEVWRSGPVEFRSALIWLTLFAAINSSDVFLILRARQLGGSDVAAIGAYIGYNIIYALASTPLGALSDRIGRKNVIACGLGLFAIVYAGLAFANAAWEMWALLGLYGIYAAATEGVARAWIGDMLPTEKRGAGLGLQSMTASLGGLVASVWTGVAWNAAGPSLPLAISAVGATVVAIGVGSLTRE
jgi:MFS family permease